MSVTTPTLFAIAGPSHQLLPIKLGNVDRVVQYIEGLVRALDSKCETCKSATLGKGLFLLLATNNDGKILDPPLVAG